MGHQLHTMKFQICEFVPDSCTCTRLLVRDRISIVTLTITVTHGWRRGLNGISYVNKGYLLAVQSSTGKVFKVDAMYSTARNVLLHEDLVGPDDIVVQYNDVAAAASPMNKLWFLKSMDSWAEGTVFDKVELDLRRFPTSVTVGDRGRMYVLYGHLNEGRMGDSGRESFGIAEIRSRKEGQDENVLIFVLIGLGLAYFFL